MLCVFLSFFSCQKENVAVFPDSTKSEVSLMFSRTISGFQWTCPKCNMINGAWRSTCVNPGCDGKYSPWHSELLLSLLTSKINLKPLETGSGYDPDRIEFPTNMYPVYSPEPWYDNAKVETYYERTRIAGIYGGNDTYLEAFDYAWYRCVRIFYPNIHTVATLNRTYSLFYSRQGKQYESTKKGKGLLEGTKCAIACFDLLY